MTRNAKVYITSRDEQRGKTAIESLNKQTGKTAYLLKLDLASFKSIKDASDEFLR